MVTSQFDRIAAQVEQLSTQEKFQLMGRIMNKLEDDLVQDAENKPKRSLYGLCADLGPAPSADDIDEVRRDMLAGFPRDDIA